MSILNFLSHTAAETTSFLNLRATRIILCLLHAGILPVWRHPLCRMAVADSLLLLLPPRTYPTGKCTRFRRHTVLPLRSLRALFVCHCIVPPTLPGHHPATATLQHDTLRAPPPFLGKAEPAVCRCGGRPQAVAVRGTPLHAEQWGTVAAARSHAFTDWYALNSGRHDETPPCLLSSAEDDVAHGHGQRCTRPWTTLHTAVDNAQGDIS